MFHFLFTFRTIKKNIVPMRWTEIFYAINIEIVAFSLLNL